MRYPALLLLLFTSLILTAGEPLAGKAYMPPARKLDTAFVETFKHLFTAKLIFGTRTNTFAVTNKLSKQSIEYSINSKVNFGFGLSYRGIGFELQFSPRALNQNDGKYGKSEQLALAASGTSRRFIYDVFYRYYAGYHTTRMFKTGSDTVATYYKRPDILNYTLGLNLIYVFNNQRFSCSAPYDLSQRQKKSSGSFLLGTYAFAYALHADSVIYPDSMYREFKPELQFSSAGSYTFGISVGYTYTLILWKNWFTNIATIPGISVQEFYSTNALTGQSYNRNAVSFSLQSKFSIGYNRKNYFIGVSWVSNNFLISDDKESTLDYKYGVFRFFYGHRFDVSRLFKKNK